MRRRAAPPSWMLAVTRHVLAPWLAPARIEEALGDVAELWAARRHAGRRPLHLLALRDIAGLTWHARPRRTPERPFTLTTFNPLLGVNTMWHDIRYAFRLMRRQALFSVLTLVTLTLGIAASTSIFTTVDRLLWKPLPFPHPEELVMVNDAPFAFGNNRMTLSGRLNAVTAFDGIGLFAEGGVNVDGLDSPVRATASVASPGFFTALGVVPHIGHTYTAEEDVAGNNAVAVISHRFWQLHFNGRPDVLTQPVYINRRPFRVTAVMPEGFSFPGATDVWIPSGADNQATGQAFAPKVLARIPAHVTWAEADAALTTLDRERGAPESTSTTPRFVGLQDQLTERVRPTLLLLAVSVGLVLIVTTTNVAGLFLARVSRRQNEFVLRLALGSGRRRLLQLIATEALCYATLAGVAGTGISLLALRSFAVLGSQTWSPAATMLDGRMLVISLAVSLFCAVLFSLAPGLAAGAHPAAQALRGGITSTRGRGWRWVRHSLVVGQVASALILLTVTTATINTMQRMANIDVGFDGENVLGVDVSLPITTYDTSDTSIQFASDVLDRLSAIPGVTAAGATSRLPGDSSVGIGISIQGADAAPAEGAPAPPSALQLSASPDYFRAMGIAVREGRPFTDADRAGAPPVVILSEGAARKLWPDGRSAVGQRIETGFRTKTVREVVGVVADVHLRGPHSTGPVVQLYLPFAQSSPYGVTSFALKTTGDPLAMAPQVRNAIDDVDPSLPVYNLRSMAQVAQDFLASQRLAMTMMGSFALLTLVLAGVGLYGVLAQLIEQQTREIGIRVALGADPNRVRWTVTAVALRLAVVGIVCGAAGAGIAARLVAAYVPRLDAIAWPTVMAHAGLLLSVALIASWIPARRASAIDPIQALKET